MKFSSTIFAKNLKIWRESLDSSQEEFASTFKSLANKKTPRAVVSSYETLESVPRLEFIFEVSEKSGATLDQLFSMELVFEAGKLKSLDMLQEPIEKQTPIPPDEMARLRRLVENLSKSLANMTKLVNDVPALRSEVERLKFELGELRKLKKQ